MNPWKTVPGVTWGIAVGENPEPIGLGEIRRVRITKRVWFGKITLVAVTAGKLTLNPPVGIGFWVDGSKPIAYRVTERGVEFRYLNWVGINASSIQRYVLTDQVADAFGIKW